MMPRLKQNLDPEAVAIRALGHIASDPGRLARFLEQTGIGPETLRDAARQPAFLAQVLDFLCADDATLMAFATNEGLRPETVALARQALAGPDPG